MRRFVVCLPAAMLAALIGLAGEEPATGRLHRPVALALVDDGQRLIVANRASGTLMIVNVADRTIESETAVGKSVSDLLTNDGKRFLATDETAGELVSFDRTKTGLRETSRRAIGRTPVSVRLVDDKIAIVACLWSRRLVVVPLLTDGRIAPGPLTSIDLPFAPRKLAVLPSTTTAIVTDGFGGSLAVVDLAAKRITGTRLTGGHNIRGLTIAGPQIYLTHQFLNSSAATRKEDIQNGNVISNNVRTMNVAGLTGRASAEAGERVYSIGDIERGAGDPADIAVDGQGRAYVALAGVNELAIGRLDDVIWTRIPVGRRPTALALDEPRGRVYVANTFGDSISVVDPAAAKVIVDIPLGKGPPTLRAEQRGELLFYDATRSHESWMSCHSCHPDGHTNGRLNDNFSDGSFGTPKRVLSLLGTRDTGPWAWNGEVTELETQVRTSFTGTMRGPSPKDAEVSDLVAYLRTLGPPPSLAVSRGTVDESVRRRGEALFDRLGCVACHKPPLFTSERTYDVGGGVKFNPPSLRGVSQGGPYFHDNRALSLDEVVSRDRHQRTGDLTAAELADLLAYLGQL